MREAYVGIYWTLPVNWADFRDLPLNVDAAAAASKTIRYQRQRVRRYVQGCAGDLIGEIAFMDTRTDRATDAVRDVLKRNASGLIASNPTLLIVRFADIRHWRPNSFVDRAAAELNLNVVDLSPDRLVIDGELFDPARHFAAWRTSDITKMASLRRTAEDELRTALAETPEINGRWQVVADLLNTREVKTIRGSSWTAENVRKLAGRLDKRPAGELDDYT